MHSNGSNRFFVSLTCDSNVYDEEWAIILMLVDRFLKEYDGGKYDNIHAHLEYSDESE